MIDGSVRAASSAAPPRESTHPWESVSALLILCTCLAWGMAVSLCPGKQPGAGLPATPAAPQMQGGDPEPGHGVLAQGPLVAHFQTHFSP